MFEQISNFQLKHPSFRAFRLEEQKYRALKQYHEYFLTHEGLEIIQDQTERLLAVLGSCSAMFICALRRLSVSLWATRYPHVTQFLDIDTTPSPIFIYLAQKNKASSRSHFWVVIKTVSLATELASSSYPSHICAIQTPILTK